MHNVRLDWIDILSFAVAFALVVAIVALAAIAFDVDLLSGGGRLVFAAVFAPIVLRRVLFGQPALREPRGGVLWSAAAVASGVVTFLGVGVMVLGTFSLTRLLDSPPDFAAEAARSHDGMSISFTVVGEPPEVTAARRAEEAEARVSRIATAAEADRAAWERARGASARRGGVIASVGFALVLAAAVVQRARYRSD